MIKIIVIGDSGVGKTSLINRYTDKAFISNNQTTIGADFVVKSISINDQNYTLQIWDTAGQERFRSLGIVFFRKAHGCVMVYDSANYDSLKHLHRWEKYFWDNIGDEENPNIPIILMGNKIELEYSFNDERLTDALKNFKYKNFPVSANTGEGVDKAFEYIAKKVVSNGLIKPVRSDIVSLNSDKNTKTSCCKFI